MRTLLPLSTLGAVLLLLGAPASAVTINWSYVGKQGNACETQSQGCFGAVSHTYKIGTYEVTNEQYAEFLNAKAASDPLGLYNTNMGGPNGGITRTGASGSFSYSATSGLENVPVNYVGFFDALRFANWMNNGQGAGDTETGAYTLEGGTAFPSNGATVTRNAGATIFLPSEDEWYKAAYHNAVGLQGTDYFDYPAGSDAQTGCLPPTTSPNKANCNNAYSPFTTAVVGSYTASASPYGTFDQGGNVLEWTDTVVGAVRVVRGGSFFDAPGALAASFQFQHDPFDPNDSVFVGFRVAPEPSRGLLLVAGVLSVFSIAGWRRARA